MQAELLEAQTECTVVFTNEDGWASGAVMTYLHLENCSNASKPFSAVKPLAERDNVQETSTTAFHTLDDLLGFVPNLVALSGRSNFGRGNN